MNNSEVLAIIEMENPDAQLMEPREQYDPCIVGLGYRFSDGPLVIYSIERVINTLMASHQCDYQNAYDFYEFNQLGSWMGEGTPIFIYEEHLINRGGS